MVLTKSRSNRFLIFLIDLEQQLLPLSRQQNFQFLLRKGFFSDHFLKMEHNLKTPSLIFFCCMRKQKVTILGSFPSCIWPRSYFSRYLPLIHTERWSQYQSCYCIRFRNPRTLLHGVKSTWDVLSNCSQHKILLLKLKNMIFVSMLHN